jgi:hypothetical protein
MQTLKQNQNASPPIQSCNLMMIMMMASVQLSMCGNCNMYPQGHHQRDTLVQNCSAAMGTAPTAVVVLPWLLIPIPPGTEGSDT